MSYHKQMIASARARYVGKRFGRLLVTEYVPGARGRHARAECVCDCGAKTSPQIANMLRGEATSCGCRREEERASYIRHGCARKGNRSRVYRIWVKMRRRCQRQADRNFAQYGGRGITVCERWQTFENFLADMGEPPSTRHSIDRIDNDGNYEPGNCRWATAAQQGQNTRRNVLNWEMVAEIRQRYSDGERVASIARAMNIGDHLARGVAGGKTWRAAIAALSEPPR